MDRGHLPGDAWAQLDAAARLEAADIFVPFRDLALERGGHRDDRRRRGGGRRGAAAEHVPGEADRNEYQHDPAGTAEAATRSRLGSIERLEVDHLDRRQVIHRDNPCGIGAHIAVSGSVRFPGGDAIDQTHAGPTDERGIGGSYAKRPAPTTVGSATARLAAFCSDKYVIRG